MPSGCAVDDLFGRLQQVAVLLAALECGEQREPGERQSGHRRLPDARGEARASSALLRSATKSPATKWPKHSRCSA